MKDTFLPDAASVLDTTASVLYDYKDKMGNVAISRCQENEIRELHHWAVQSLRNVQRVGCVISLPVIAIGPFYPYFYKLQVKISS